jgi:3-oxoacyl-[acyl-carrier protein] reductase
MVPEAAAEVAMTVSFDFGGRAVIVTGAAGGIGLAVAERFTEAGARVWLADVDEDAAEVAAAGMPGATGVHCDVRDPAAANALAERVVAEAGGVDVLVNNAGILRDRMLWKLTDADWSAVIGVHLTGTFNCTRAVVPAMRERGRGRIVNVTSYTGLHGNVGQAAYAAAKAGIVGLTKTSAKELGRFGITVNAISPLADTAMVASIPAEQRERLEQLVPAGRVGAPEEIAPAVAFLASDEAAYITGAVLPVDGGRSM